MAPPNATNALTGIHVLVPCSEFQQKGRIKYAGLVGQVDKKRVDHNAVYFYVDKMTVVYPRDQILSWQVVTPQHEEAWQAQASDLYASNTDTDSVLDSESFLSDSSDGDSDSDSEQVPS